MDQTNCPDAIDQIYRLLAFCARAEGFPAFYEQLIHKLELFTAWAELPKQAEANGMAPLLRHHLLQSGYPIPIETRQILTGLYLRHRELNKAHTKSLIEILALLDRYGICPILLKGLGLAYQYYPEPALRPTTDIDLLIQKDEIAPVQHLLTEAGYNPKFPDAHFGWVSKEMTAQSPLRDGISTYLEIHHYDPSHRSYDDLSLDQEFANFILPLSSIEIEGRSVQVPAPTDNLRYLSRHIAHHLPKATAEKPLQLKWSADIISLIERHTNSIDWEFIHKNDPATCERVNVLFSLTPIHPSCIKTIPIRQPSPPPKGVNQYPTGWPRQAFKQVKRGGLWKFIAQTLKPPSEWWLRLYYGVRHPFVSWYAFVVYPLRTFKMLCWAIIRSIKYT